MKDVPASVCNTRRLRPGLMGSSLYPSLVGFRGIADTISHEVAADMSLEKVGKDGLPGRVALDGSFQIRGTVILLYFGVLITRILLFGVLY